MLFDYDKKGEKIEILIWLKITCYWDISQTSLTNCTSVFVLLSVTGMPMLWKKKTLKSSEALSSEIKDGTSEEGTSEEGTSEDGTSGISGTSERTNLREVLIFI